MSLYERIRSRADQAMAAAGVDALLVGQAPAVRYLSGYAPPFETGTNPMEGGPALGLLVRGGGQALVVHEWEGGAAQAAGGAGHVQAYVGYDVHNLADPGANYRDAAVAASRALGLSGGRLAVDPGVPHAVVEAVVGAVGAMAVPLAAGVVERLRAVKEPEEVDLLRRAVGLCDAGQAAARGLVRAGATEMQIWAGLRLAMEQAAGSRVPLLADLVSGPRTAEVGGPPSNRVLASDDLVICDLAPCLEGYWGDSCITVAAGAPSAEHRKAHAAVLGALERATAAIRPGVRAHEVDAAARTYLAERGYEYPHHTGHGIGATWHEEPRIYPASATVLAPGMVVALEPGAYGAFGGVRVEHVVLVTESGCTILSRHDTGL